MENDIKRNLPVKYLQGFMHLEGQALLLLTKDAFKLLFHWKSRTFRKEMESK